MTRFIPSVYTLVFMVALPINVMAIFIFLIKIKVRKPAVVYMLNLAIADVLFIIFLPFTIIYRFSGNDWRIGEGMCRLVTAAFNCNMYCSVLLMTSISVDRFLAVVYPIQSLYWRTTTRAWMACILTWILAISSTVPLLITQQTYHIKTLNITTCHDMLPLEVRRNFYAHYFTTYISLLFFLPLIITTFCYIGVIRKLSSTAIVSTFSRSRAVVLTVTVLCVFVLGFGPANIIFFFHYLSFYKQPSEMLYVMYIVCVCISSISCCLDPLIYCYGFSKCQTYLQSLMCCKTESGSEGEPTYRSKCT
ncbi:proteinase-activated receptor 1-like [Bufo gargarizans]|uniref:proteinase-activated receptor 1-like n=1 Tax=Bufo gargarizans TaxID=30331 RepID=UPI001CF457AE|nr:proteinase-activated receptor 1-like [Bufo gargarizans]